MLSLTLAGQRTVVVDFGAHSTRIGHAGNGEPSYPQNHVGRGMGSRYRYSEGILRAILPTKPRRTRVGSRYRYSQGILRAILPTKPCSTRDGG